MSDFLKITEIPIGSWWAAADGQRYGNCVLSIDEKTNDVTVLGDNGEIRKIDAFKLQYRYKRAIPNEYHSR